MTRVAAIDCGTNSTRLLVAGPGDPLDTVERYTKVTRLGAAVDRTGHLDDDALERTVVCIGEYHDRAVELGAERFRIAATSAIRDASDRDRFVEAVAARTGESAEVLSGEEEAAVSFRGATSAVAGQTPYLVLDIGGGSTELIVGSDRPEASTSRQLGCVRLYERHLATDPPSGAELAAADADAAAELDAAVQDVGADRARTVVGVAGTVTTLAALHLGLDDYDPTKVHGTRLPTSAVAHLLDYLAAMTSGDRAGLGPMRPGREDVIVAGTVILRAALRRLGADEVLVSEADILDGLALSLLEA